MSRVKAEAVLVVCATATVVTTTIVVADCGALSMGALIAGYFFESIMFPTIFALSLRGLGEKTKRASSFLMMTPVGGAVGRGLWDGWQTHMEWCCRLSCRWQDSLWSGFILYLHLKIPSNERTFDNNKSGR